MPQMQRCEPRTALDAAAGEAHAPAHRRAGRFRTDPSPGRAFICIIDMQHTQLDTGHGLAMTLCHDPAYGAGGTYRIGDVTVTRVGEQYGPGYAPEFLFPDWDQAVLDEHRDWMIPGCFSEADLRFIASIHTWVVRTRHHTILIDSCAGNHKNRPSLPRFHQLDLPFLDRLAAAGVDPGAVDYVLCTHLHADHCGWNTRLIDGRWVPTFPRARYVFSKTELSHWSGQAGHGGFNEGVYADSVLPVIESGQALVIDGEGQVDDNLTLHPTPGHSVGHLAIGLCSRGEEALFSGDVMQPFLRAGRGRAGLAALGARPRRGSASHPVQQPFCALVRRTGRSPG